LGTSPTSSAGAATPGTSTIGSDPCPTLLLAQQVEQSGN
jgi:hypothetical protein